MASKAGRLIYQSKRWRLLRKHILRRDGYRCRLCNRAGRLEVDHATPIVMGGDWWNPSNLRAVCRSCHIAKTREANMKPRSPARAELRELANASL